MNLQPYREKLLNIIIDLIENSGVTQFYSGFRGNYDEYCCNLIYELKHLYPQIKMTLVLSYIPEQKKTRIIISVYLNVLTTVYIFWKEKYQSDWQLSKPINVW